MLETTKSARCRLRRGFSGTCRALFFAVFALMLPGSTPTKAADSVIAPTGTLRAAYIVANVAQGQVDPATGAVTGVIAPLATAAAVLEAVRGGTADIGFVAPNPERTGVVLYSNTYMLVQQSALVRADSSLRSVSELDRSGHVVGINTDDSVGVWLRQRLSHATVRPTPDYTLGDAVRWLQSGEVVAFAGGRQRLRSGTRHVQGLRMLDDNFYGVPQTIAVPLDQERRLALVNSALEDFRVSGLLADWIARSGIDGLSVAPRAAQSR
jgi:polar amino acid transport system substrate-binding protein